MRDHMSYDPALDLPLASGTPDPVEEWEEEEEDEAPKYLTPARRAQPPQLPPPILILDEYTDPQVLSNTLVTATIRGGGPIRADHIHIDPPSPLVVTLYDIGIYANDLYRLEKGEWLNATIIDATMSLIQEEEVTLPVRIHCAHVNFFHNLRGRETQATRDRRHQLDLINHIWLFFPAATMGGTHWSLIVVNVVDRVIYYVDSLGRDGTEEMRLIESFLLRDADVHTGAKRGRSWTLHNCHKTSSQQDNSSDCGVFVCETTRLWIRYLMTQAWEAPPLTQFTAREIPRIRRRMQLDLIRAGRAKSKALPPPLPAPLLLLTPDDDEVVQVEDPFSFMATQHNT